LRGSVEQIVLGEKLKLTDSVFGFHRWREFQFQHGF
jgi:hypothetical protein